MQALSDRLWWSAFFKALANDRIGKSARDKGESFAHCWNKVREAGGRFTTAVDTVSGAGLLITGSTMPLGTRTERVVLQDRAIGKLLTWRTVPGPSAAERVAASAARDYGTVSKAGVAATGRVAGVVAKYSGIVTAVAIGLELGSAAACRNFLTR